MFRVRVRLRVRISDLLAYITYFIVTVIIGFVERAANLAAAGTLVVGDRMPAAGTLYKTLLFLVGLSEHQLVN